MIYFIRVDKLTAKCVALFSKIIFPRQKRLLKKKQTVKTVCR